MPTLKIAVGSENPVKLAAAEAILRRAYPQAIFVVVSVPSGVPDQPRGNDETRQGALNRAHAARLQTGADYGLGLEGGLIDTPVGLMTCAWCAIVDATGRVGYGGGANILLPPLVADVLRGQGELGPVMDELIHEDNTKQKHGAIGILTNGLSDRQTAYEQLVAMAAGPFVTSFYETE